MSNLHVEDTITAIATPPGIGAISVIRISGNNTFKAVDSIFRGKILIAEVASHTIHYGKIVNPSDELIDDVLISVFKNPHSYTGEDSVEISTHGNPYITQQIIELLLTQNIRIAEPGEFTKRAFLNGKIDLTQAEAVVDVINSRTAVSFRGARNQLDGLLSKKVRGLRNLLLNTSSYIELELDFAEENLEFIGHRELLDRVDRIITEIDNLSATYSFGKIIRDGINVSIAGKPNVGKSSLLNYILKESRAIVSNIPGTTRDIIKEYISIDGILFRLYDTAGIRIPNNEIEKEGVIRSRETVKNSDIVIFLNDIETGISKELYQELLSLTEKQKIITVVNKIDIDPSKAKNFDADLFISALTGEGIDQLFMKLKSLIHNVSGYTEKSAVVSNLRHYNCLIRAKENLLNAKFSIAEKLSGEFIAVDLRNAESDLGEIIGEVTSDDILNNIFMKFCIGK